MAKVEQAQAAGRVSNASGLLIKMLRDHDHLRLNDHNGRPTGERCWACGNPDVQDYSRFNGGSPLFLCGRDAEMSVTVDGVPRTFAELAAEAASG